MRRARLALLLALLAVPVLGSAQDSAGTELEQLRERIAWLEERMYEVEAGRVQSDLGTRREDPPVRISGSANFGYLDGRDDSRYAEAAYQITDARFFLDAELARDLSSGGRTLLRDASFVFEWNVVRIGSKAASFEPIGDLYADLRGLGGNEWLNLQLGRFQIPFGENYLRYGRGRPEAPFISNSFLPWFWDEGVKLFGSQSEGRFGYVFGLTNGETDFNRDLDQQKQLSLRLFARPWPSVYLSVSGLRSGTIGSPTRAAGSAIWLGEAWGRAFGDGSSVANYDHGVAVPDGPNELENVQMLGGDLIVTTIDGLRLWLSYGIADVDSTGPSLYDRSLHYWLAELVAEGRRLSPGLAPLYLALRANGLGTYDADRGYLLDVRDGSTLGFNTEALEAYSVAAGWRFSDGLVLRAEYTRSDIDLVRGVSPAMRDAARNADFFGAELGVSF
jgi:hypothetical protein